MKEKILAALSAVSGQYNLPKEQLEKIVLLAPSDLAEDKIESWVESMKGTMQLMQSYADSRVTAAGKELENVRKEFEDFKKKHNGSTATDLEVALGAMRKELEASFDEKLKGYSDLQSKYDELVNRQASIDKLERERQFAEIKKRVASELHLSDKALEFLSGKLTSDMDEAKVNEVLSEGKKLLVEMGLPSAGGGKIDQVGTEAAKARAKAFLDNLEKQQNQATE